MNRTTNDYDEQIILHIWSRCWEISKTVRRFGDEYEIFVSDADYYNSVCFNLMQIGIFATRLSDDYKKASRRIVSWGLWIGLSNSIRFSYLTLDKRVIWEIITGDIPVLRKACA